MAYKEYDYVLYHNVFSLCSLMVRYAFACRGEPKDGASEVILKEEAIDIVFNKEQLSEHYLCDVNRNGEVPVLVLEDGTGMPESVDITLFLADHYPQLAPKEHRAEIERLLRELHTISFFALTFAGRPQGQLASKQILSERLQGDISDRYREAIGTKLKRIEDSKLSALADEAEKTNLERTKGLVRKFESILQKSNTDWCLSLPEPSALDAHLVVFIARMFDVNREGLLPDVLKHYGEKAMAGEAWRDVMQGRKTLPS